jgi:PAS domain S-box-containing protein
VVVPVKDSGLDLIGPISWGFHLCLLYRNKEDLLEILLPYIKAGLAENDLVIWVTDDPLPQDDLENILQRELINFAEVRKKGQLQLYSSSEWYFSQGKIDFRSIQQRWQEKEKEADIRGFSGLRVTGNISGVPKSMWSQLHEYEGKIHASIGQSRMMAICQYDLNRCSPEQIVDILQYHPHVLIQRDKKWVALESPASHIFTSKLKEREKPFASLVQSSHAGVLIVDDQYRFLFVNDELCRMLGYEREEIVGRDFRDFLDEESQALVADRYRRRQKGERVPPRYEFNVVRKDAQKRRVEIISTVVKDSQGRPQTVAQILDITDKKRAEQALAESESYYRSIFENAHDAIIIFEPREEIILDANPRACELYGLPREKFIGRSLKEFSKDVARGRRYIKQTLENGSLRELQTIHMRPDGQEMFLEINAAVISYKGQLAIISIHRDVTERIRTRQALEEERAFLNELFEATPAAIVMSDEKARVIRINKEFTRLFGYTPDEAIGRHVDELVVSKEEMSRVRKIYQPKLERGESVVYEAVRKTKKGKNIDVLVTVTPIVVEGRLRGFYALYQDISHRKKAEIKLRESLKEKTVLLQEIHHRVKNNMQLIASLLRLQASRTQNEEYRQLVDVSYQRIRSMALVHESLYRMENLARIDFADYTDRLVSHLYAAYFTQERKKKIKVNVDVQNVFLDINQAIPCGLILNELVSNAFKYAFVGRNSGKLEVVMHPQGRKDYRLEVSDNGIGLPPEVDLNNLRTLGLQIVVDLVKQLEGRLEVDREEGTSFAIIFPRKRLK